MVFSFEVRETDLLGRIGTLTVNGRRLETPCLFPVVHPVVQSVGPQEIRSAGFECLMTNAFILYRRRKDEALEVGLHRLLGFDGVVMTDSGGYQVLEYGDLDLPYGEIASFQSSIGSDLAVTLDRPTGYTASRERARDTEEYSTRNALGTLRQFRGSETTWVGPIQGGLYSDILAKSARSLSAGGFSFLALGSPVQVMENYMYRELVSMITTARRNLPYSTPLHLFGAGHPHAMAISVALGCDTFDSASYMLFARAGRYMTERGVSTLKEMKYLPCSCPVCRSESVADLLEMEERERVKRLATHNLYLLGRELELCKEAIAEGRLWDLVEERTSAHPKLTEAFGVFAGFADHLEPGTAPLKGKGLFVRGPLDAGRPELRTAQGHLTGALRRSSRTALLIEGEGPIPVRRLGRTGLPRALSGCDAYRLHPQLGPYPVELDFVYPFTQTVTAGSSDESFTKRGAQRLRKMGYSKVVVATADSSGRIAVKSPRNKLKRAAASPSPRTASLRPRAPRPP